MKVTIDGKETALTLAATASIDQIFDALKIAIGNDRIISSCALDGVEFSKESEKSAVKKTVADIGVLTVATDSPREQALRVQNTVLSFLKSFESTIDGMIAFLQAGGEEDVYDQFLEGLKGLRNVFSFLDVLSSLAGLSVSDVVVGTKKADLFLKDFEASLGELQTAIQDRDIVYVQDILRYELKPNLRMIKEIVDTLVKKLG